MGARETRFSFKVYNPRMEQDISYDIKKTEQGWDIQYYAHSGECDADGKPLFYANFNQDNMSYPSNLSMYLTWLWEDTEYHDISDADLQQRLQELADWVSKCTKSKPDWEKHSFE